MLNRLVQHLIDGFVYALRNRVKRCFSSLKNAWRVASCGDKTPANYRDFTLIRALQLWIGHFVNRAL
jgi:hypothetical protein